jgi:hypothetical protein
MKYWSLQILFKLWDSLLQFKVMVLTLSWGLVLSFLEGRVLSFLEGGALSLLEGGVFSSFIIADSCCFLGQI